MVKAVTLVLVSFSLLMLPGVANAAGAHATPVNSIRGVATGEAFASYVHAVRGSVTYTNGPVLLIAGNCLTANFSHAASGARVRLVPSALSTGGESQSVDDTVHAAYGTSTASVESISRIQHVNLLGGMIKAGAMTAEANTSATAKSVSSNANGTSIAGLVINGQKVSAKPNETVPLSGVGTVTIDQQSKPATGSSSHIWVNLINVHFAKGNTLGVTPGSELIVGHAYSSYALTFSSDLVGAGSYGFNSYVQSGKDAAFSSGPQALAGIPCLGGSAENVVNKVQSPAGSTATIDDTAKGRLTSSGAKAHAQSKVASPLLPSVLSSMVSAGALDVKVSASFKGVTPGHSFSFTAGSLKINGQTVSSGRVPANDSVVLKGVGYAILNERHVKTTKYSVQASINGIDVHVTKKNAYGLPVGATIVFAHAQASARRVFLTKP
ncbi:MAG TPA: choice-of-anchor P family protein [Chloroflexota bacterium]|nr:choice-of-anchor P family protein [Chloroflexota bacterium]